MIATLLVTLCLSGQAIRMAKPQIKQVADVYSGPENDIEVWYINQAKNTDRNQCMEGQLRALNIKPNRFEAVAPTTEGLKEGGEFFDCVKGGFLRDAAYTDATGGHIARGAKVKNAVIGDTCSHKRLFQQLAKSKSSAKYFLVLEDDAIVNPEKLKGSLNQFINEYKGPNAKDWQMVQLDFIGDFCKDHVVGEAGGSRVFKPKDIYKPGAEHPGGVCSRYYGSHALLVQKEQLSSVVEHLESHKTQPMDHVQGELPRALSWRPKVVGTNIRKFTALPEYCSKDVKKSTISKAFIETQANVSE